MKTKKQAGKFSKQIKFQEDENFVIQDQSTNDLQSELSIERQFPEYFKNLDFLKKEPEIIEEDIDEANDYLELNIQSLNAYKNMQGNFIDNGQSEVKESVDYYLEEGHKNTKGL